MAINHLEIDVLLSGAQYVAHQCNCSTQTAKGLAQTVFSAHPRANTYAVGAPRRCGDVGVFPPEDGGMGVLNCYAQLGPGGPDRKEDTTEKRLSWFQECLQKIGEIEDLRSVAFPHMIGCGLARGEWADYEKALTDFASTFPSVRVTVCTPPGNATASPKKKRRVR